MISDDSFYSHYSNVPMALFFSSSKQNEKLPVSANMAYNFVTAVMETGPAAMICKNFE